MALVAVHAVVHIPADVRMLEIARVPAAMAIRALEYRVVAGIGVTGRADSICVAVVDVEPGVIEHGPGPCGRRMAGVACRWEAGGLVVRIGRAVVVRLVATHARRRQRRVVVVDMAHHAGHGCSCVEASQGECRVVVIKDRA